MEVTFGMESYGITKNKADPKSAQNNLFTGLTVARDATERFVSAVTSQQPHL